MNEIVKFYNNCTKTYHSNLYKDKNGYNYLIKRGILPCVLEKMYVGYVGNYNLLPNVGNFIRENSNLFNDNGDYFRNCVIFPCFWKNNVVYFSSRSLSNQLPHKHLRGSINIVYNANIIFNSNKPIYLTEGCIDTLTLLSYGKPTAGLLGANRLNDRIARAFKDKRVIMVMDSDEPGRMAALRNSGTLQRNGAKPYILYLPDDTDVNSFFQQYTIHDFNDLLKNILIPYTSTEHYLQNKNKKTVISSGEYDIERVIKHYKIEKKLTTGKGYMVNCPLPDHLDNKASMHIYTETQSFYCFGDSKAGNAIDLIRFIENISKKEALLIYSRL